MTHPNNTCPNCGGPLLGDGYCKVFHCDAAADVSDREPDSKPVACAAPELTDEQLRIAVAEKVGWTAISRGGNTLVDRDKARGIPPGMHFSYRTALPAFESSLNFMAEARKVLSPQQVSLYTTALLKETGATGWDDEAKAPWFNIWAIADASPRQHALAFLACFEEEK